MTNVDIFWTMEGDLSLTDETLYGGSDFEDTRYHSKRNRIQRVATRVGSSPDDWKLSNVAGANLGRFVGKPNVESVGLQIRDYILQELLRDELLGRDQIEVNVIPVSESAVTAIVQVRAAGSGEAFSVPFTYDMRDNKLVPRRG